MKEIRLIVKVKNNILLSKREELGLSQQKLADMVKINMQLLCHYETLFLNPLGVRGYSKTAIKLSKFFKMLPEDLFPKDLYKIKRVKVEKQISLKEVENYLTYSEQLALPVDERFDDTELHDVIDEVLKTLTPKEEQIIKDRFGFYGDEKSLETIAREFDVTRERIRQIEDKALQKLHRRSLFDKMKPFVKESYDDYDEYEKLKKIREDQCQNAEINQ